MAFSLFGKKQPLADPNPMLQGKNAVDLRLANLRKQNAPKRQELVRGQLNRAASGLISRGVENARASQVSAPRAAYTSSLSATPVAPVVDAGFQSKLNPNDPTAIGGAAMAAQRSAVAPTEDPSSPVVPPVVPQQDNSLKDAYDAYIASLAPSSAAQDARRKYLDFVQSRDLGLQEVADKPIPMRFVTGQQESLQRLSGIEEQRRLGELGLAQEADMAAQAQAKARLDYAKMLEEAKAPVTPIEVGGALIDPRTGKVVYQAPEKKQPPIELAEGNTLYDPVTGKAIYTAPKTYKATGGGAGGGGGTGTLSALAQSVYDNPALLGTLTPTVKGQILTELAGSGKDVSRFGLQNLGATQRAEVALFDEIENEASYAKSLYDKGVDTGPIAGRFGVFGQKIGTTGEDFTNLKSAIDNMGSILLRMRSGAAVTPQEFERIAGFIPSINEDEKTAKTKIDRFYQAINDAKQNYITRQTQSTYQITQQPQSGFGAQGAVDPLGIR